MTGLWDELERHGLSARARLLVTLLRHEFRALGDWPLTFGALHGLAAFPSRSTTHRALRELIDAGLAEQSPFPMGGFRPTPPRDSDE